MALNRLPNPFTWGAGVVNSATERLRSQRARLQLEDELDNLFAELGIEVYQRLTRGDPVEGAVVIEDIVDRISEIEARLDALSEGL